MEDDPDVSVLVYYARRLWNEDGNHTTCIGGRLERFSLSARFTTRELEHFLLRNSTFTWKHDPDDDASPALNSRDIEAQAREPVHIFLINGQPADPSDGKTIRQHFRERLKERHTELRVVWCVYDMERDREADRLRARLCRLFVEQRKVQCMSISAFC